MNNAFQLRYDLNREVWEDCHLGFFIEPHSLRPITAQVVADRLADKEIAMPTGGSSQLSQISPTSLKALSFHDGQKIACAMIAEALHYSSNFPMPDGEPQGLATAFISSFNSPQIFANASYNSSSNSWGWVPITAHTFDAVLCCADESHIGCVLTCNDE